MRTMMVKPAPRLATILWRWLGRLAMPIGEAFSAVGAIVNVVAYKRRDGEWIRYTRPLRNHLEVAARSRRAQSDGQGTDWRC